MELELRQFHAYEHGLVGKTILNRFVVERVLGKGSFGIACAAHDKQRRKTVVLKETNLGAEIPKEKVREEAVLLTSLNHTHIVQFYECFFDCNSFYIIIEYCEGGDLATKIRKTKDNNETIPPNLFLKWTYHMLIALEYLHSKNVLHRDLKPANVLLVGNDAKLCDFGISRQLQHTQQLAMTCNVGTFTYTSPEMFKGLPYGPKSDIWSLGCVFYELVKLDPITENFARDSIFKYINQVISKKILPDLKEKRFDNLFKKMAVFDVKSRPTASELLQDSTFKQYSGGSAGPEELKVVVKLGRIEDERVGAVFIWESENVDTQATTGTNFMCGKTFVKKIPPYVPKILLGRHRFGIINRGHDKVKQEFFEILKNSLEKAEEEAYSVIAMCLPDLGYPVNVVSRWMQDEFRRFRSFHLHQVNLVLDPEKEDSFQVIDTCVVR
uniref:serine/threonine-protein kinase Nek11-like n=1 Tax=Ciona intestinalis TaxID=7719 RepID=UPI000EF482E2|nr:serine/threonine-protein kinase Nek11-like [Ciona intestinalis]|eukprot:XP_018670897.2 serine/threonine-protein kinase Nek11-like [Ciona intestinalis]